MTNSIVRSVMLLAFSLALVLQAGAQKPEIKNGPRETKSVQPGEPSPLLYDAGAIAANKVRFLLTTSENKGGWSLVELTENPGTKTTWHRHNRTDQAYYVLEGKLTFKVEDRTYEFGPGGYVFIPRGTPHGHANLSDAPVRVLLTNSPGGFELYFIARAELLKTMKPIDLEFKKKMSEYRKKYDAEELGSW